jgi:hypothetical protein
MPNCFDVFPIRFAARSVKVDVPEATGVPLINPLEAFKESPAGKLLAVMLQVIGAVPVALSVIE